MGSIKDQMTRKLLTKLARIGPERVTIDAQVVKLMDEVAEVAEAVRGDQDADSVLLELADVVVVAHTAARVLGFSAAELDDAVESKMLINASREWYPTASGTARHTPEEP